MRILIRDLTDGQDVLTGAQPGRQLFGRLVASAASPAEPEPGYLDFDRISVATASYLRESIIAFRDYARSTLPGLYPVIANASDSITEELEFFLRHRKDAIWVCRLSPKGQPSDSRILGELDRVHRDTFDLVTRMGTATAPELAAHSPTALAPTAWNNRLSSLANRGLLVERRVGKAKAFAPVLEIA